MSVQLIVEEESALKWFKSGRANSSLSLTTGEMYYCTTLHEIRDCAKTCNGSRESGASSRQHLVVNEPRGGFILARINSPMCIHNIKLHSSNNNNEEERKWNFWSLSHYWPWCLWFTAKRSGWMWKRSVPKVRAGRSRGSAVRLSPFASVSPFCVFGQLTGFFCL